MATELTQLLNKLEEKKQTILSEIDEEKKTIINAIDQERNSIITAINNTPITKQEFELYKEEVSKMIKDLTDKLDKVIKPTDVALLSIDSSKFAPYTETNSKFY